MERMLYVRPENPLHRLLSMLYAADLHPQQVITPAAGKCVRQLRPICECTADQGWRHGKMSVEFGQVWTYTTVQQNKINWQLKFKKTYG